MSLWLAFDLERTASMRETPIEGFTPLFSSRRDALSFSGHYGKRSDVLTLIVSKFVM